MAVAVLAHTGATAAQTVRVVDRTCRRRARAGCRCWRRRWRVRRRRRVRMRQHRTLRHFAFNARVERSAITLVAAEQRDVVLARHCEAGVADGAAARARTLVVGYNEEATRVEAGLCWLADGHLARVARVARAHDGRRRCAVVRGQIARRRHARVGGFAVDVAQTAAGHGDLRARALFGDVARRAATAFHVVGETARRRVTRVDRRAAVGVATAAVARQRVVALARRRVARVDGARIVVVARLARAQIHGLRRRCYGCFGGRFRRRRRRRRNTTSTER